MSRGPNLTRRHVIAAQQDNCEHRGINEILVTSIAYVWYQNEQDFISPSSIVVAITMNLHFLIFTFLV